MSGTYTLNSEIIKKMPPQGQDKPHTHVGLILTLLAAVIIGVIIWWGTMQQNSPQPMIDKQAALRAEVAELLKAAPVNYSQADIDRMAKLLAASKTNITEADRQNMAQLLKQ